MIFLINGITTTGKTLLIKNLLKKDPKLKFLVSATTRKPRPGEINGRHYYFLSHEEFNNYEKNNKFFETIELYGNKYGTFNKDLMQNDYNIIADLDLAGCIKIKNAFPKKTISIMLLPPNLSTVLFRLSKRQCTSNALKRILETPQQLLQNSIFDYILINNQGIDILIEKVLNIIAIENLKYHKVHDHIHKLQQEFDNFIKNYDINEKAIDFLKIYDIFKKDNVHKGNIIMNNPEEKVKKSRKKSVTNTEEIVKTHNVIEDTIVSLENVNMENIASISDLENINMDDLEIMEAIEENIELDDELNSILTQLSEEEIMVLIEELYKKLDKDTAQAHQQSLRPRREESRGFGNRSGFSRGGDRRGGNDRRGGRRDDRRDDRGNDRRDDRSSHRNIESESVEVEVSNDAKPNYTRAYKTGEDESQENRGGRSFGGDRGRSFGGRSSFGSDRSGRSFGGDRERRSFDGENKTDGESSFSNRGPRSFGGDRGRSFGGRSSFGSDRGRSFGGRSSFGGDRGRSFGGDRKPSFSSRDKKD